MRPHLPSWIALLAIASTFGCSGAAEIPDTPDLTALQEEYRQPSAQLDTDTVEETLAEFPPLDQLEAGFRASGYATTGVNDAGDTASKKSSSSINIQGSLRVNLRCPGDLDDPSYDRSTNGSLSLTLGVENNRIKRGVGGTANECVLRGRVVEEPVRVVVDGPVAFDLGGDIGLRDRWSGTLLVFIIGTISIGDLVLENLSARYTEERLEYLHRRSGDRGTVVAEVSADGIRIRDHDVVWFCRSGEPCTPQ